MTGYDQAIVAFQNNIDGADDRPCRSLREDPYYHFLATQQQLPLQFDVKITHYSRIPFMNRNYGLTGTELIPIYRT